MDGSKLSLATVSTVSTGPYSHSDESVEVLAKPLVTEESTTIPYSQSYESIQLEEKRDEKEKASDVTDAREENKEEGKNSDKGAVSPVPVSPVKNYGEQEKKSDKGAVSPVKNYGEQVKYSVVAEPVSPVKNHGEGKNSDKGDVSPVPVSPVKNYGEQEKKSDKGAVSPVKNYGEQVKYSVVANTSVLQKSASSDSSTETTDSTDSTDSVSKAPTVMTATCKATTCKQEYAAAFGPQNSPTQEEQS